MAENEQYEDATLLTGDNLRTIIYTPEVRELSSMSLPEIEEAVDLIAKVAPAGNVPGVILNGLIRLPDRKLPLKDVKRDIRLLFRGVEQTVRDRAVYTAFFAGPAAIIFAYQKLMQLAGKNPDTAFPEGVWQFYTDYALRDDTARHANETHGFDTLLTEHHIRLHPVDRLTAWVMAAIYTLHQYDALLVNEWRERVYTYTLAELTADSPDAIRYGRLYRIWEKQRPYSRGSDADPRGDYPSYRRQKFDAFLNDAMRDLPADAVAVWKRRIRTATDNDLPDYQQQMSILAYLDPGPYGETRVPIPLNAAHVGLIHQGRYYLIPACLPDSEQPPSHTHIRAQIAAILTHPADVPPASLERLARIRRPAFADLRGRLNADLQKELDTLRLAPIWINADPRPRRHPLSTLRQTERGLGDHPLTIFDTGETFVFDQSHIFFDGAWGAALAEIITNEALAWAVYFNTLSPPQIGDTRPYAPQLTLTADDEEQIRRAPTVMPEAGVESDQLNLDAIRDLRRMFKERNDLLKLTVNDLLILYRAIHAAQYTPSTHLQKHLKTLADQPAAATAVALTREALTAGDVNPAVLIPVDASRRQPRDRVFPLTFEVPLAHLDLLNLHQQVLDALEACRKTRRLRGRKEKEAACAQFEELQKSYLGMLAGFGEVLSRFKEIAVAGESASVGSIKLLAHMPKPLQRLLETIPSRFDVLNDLIRGREVFSNVGAVVPDSTLTRFITAKDDNEKKTLAWGVMTDAEGVTRITLRDFRPHVTALIEAGHRDTAVRIAQEYLDAYVHGLNTFTNDLIHITSRRSNQGR